MAAQGTINYAKAIGIDSVAAAVVFAVLYIPLLGLFIFKSIRLPTYVHFVLTIFCSIRVTAFIIRAVLAGVDSAGQNLSLLTGDEILFGVGYFGLLYSAYTLVLDRELLSDRPPSKNPILLITQNRRLFRLLMSAAIAMGIAGTSMTQGSSGSSTSTGDALRKAGAIIFLVLTILQAFQTLVLARDELHYGQESSEKENTSFGKKHGIHILLLISVLLLLRESFSVGTIGDAAEQNNEKLWYPLLALPEVIAVALYATPGLVPPRSELPQ